MAWTGVSAASTLFPRGVAGADKQPFVLFRQHLLSHHLPTLGAARELQIPGNKTCVSGRTQLGFSNSRPMVVRCCMEQSRLPLALLLQEALLLAEQKAEAFKRLSM